MTLLLTSCCPFSLRFIIKFAVDIFIEIGRVFTFVKISSLLFFSCPVCSFIFNLQIRYQVMPYSAQYRCTLEGSCFFFKYICDTSYAKCCLIYLSPYSLVEMTCLYVIIALGIWEILLLRKDWSFYLGWVYFFCGWLADRK